MDWHYGCPPIRMTHKMMASLYSLDKNASTSSPLHRNPLNAYKIELLKIIFLNF
jgi:hypothetical protein